MPNSSKYLHITAVLTQALQGRDHQPGKEDCCSYSPLPQQGGYYYYELVMVVIMRQEESIKRDCWRTSYICWYIRNRPEFGIPKKVLKEEGKNMY